MKPRTKEVEVDENQRLQLCRRTDGQLWATEAGREARVRVQRCFPWSEPSRYVSLRDADDREFSYVEDTAQLDDASKAVLHGAMAEAGFLLEITEVEKVVEEVEIRSWWVTTRQGKRSFQTRLDDWPLQIPGGGLLIRDVAGDLYHVPDLKALNETSRGWLWAYAG